MDDHEDEASIVLYSAICANASPYGLGKLNGDWHLHIYLESFRVFLTPDTKVTIIHVEAPETLLHFLAIAGEA
jgi:hypothetical protein